MRHVVAIVAMLALLSNCTHSLMHYRVYSRGNIMDLGDRIGEVIDAEERAEYDLFPYIDGFEEARIYAIPDGGYEMVIVTDHGKYVAVNRDLQAQQIVKDYFSRYGTSQYSRHYFENRWHIIAYDVLGFPITEAEVSKNWKAWCCLGGSLGCGLVSFGASFALASVIAFGELSSQNAGENDELYIGGIISGTVAGMLTGALVGRAFENRRALKAIKEARKPRVFE